MITAQLISKYIGLAAAGAAVRFDLNRQGSATGFSTSKLDTIAFVDGAGNKVDQDSAVAVTAEDDDGDFFVVNFADIGKMKIQSFKVLVPEQFIPAETESSEDE
jgi:hypothetical protein